LSWDVLLQRLFSTFPNSWPGTGLLLLRACLALAIIYFGIPGLLRPSGTIRLAQDLIATASGIFLLGGLWTPVIGALVALDEVWIALSLSSPRREQMWIHIFLAILAVSAAMLGPGVWSIDARMFGRRRLAINPTRRRNDRPK
jgi:uncharacterized membrane protein YphA (DoxX/SURF4 family)